jgi:hypothetical protein
MRANTRNVANDNTWPPAMSATDHTTPLAADLRLTSHL